MTQIFTTTQNQVEQVLDININDPAFDLLQAKQIAKDKAHGICENPMILSWKKFFKTKYSFDLTWAFIFSRNYMLLCHLYSDSR